MRFRVLLVVLTCFCLTAPVWAERPERAERPEPEVHGTFDGDEMYTLLPPDAIPAITDPEYVTGAAAAAQMSDQEPVIGVATATDAVCWSAWQLDHHEIVNDILDGTAIAATW